MVQCILHVDLSNSCRVTDPEKTLAHTFFKKLTVVMKCNGWRHVHTHAIPPFITEIREVRRLASTHVSKQGLALESHRALCWTSVKNHCVKSMTTLMDGVGYKILEDPPLCHL